MKIRRGNTIAVVSQGKISSDMVSVVPSWPEVKKQDVNWTSDGYICGTTTCC